MIASKQTAAKIILAAVALVTAAVVALAFSGCETTRESRDWPGVTISPNREPSFEIDGQKFWIQPTPTPGRAK